MPELPEVQTVVNSLQTLANKQFTDFRLYEDKVLYNQEYKLELQKTITNKTISSIFRKGKYIIIDLNNNYLAFHLRMTGYLYTSTKLNRNKYSRCYFTASDNTYLLFEDVRKFGGFYYYNSLDDIEKKIGIDPFDINFTAEWIANNILKKKCQMKNLLLNQKFICGLGNIYVDEILWKSNIHPLKKSSSLLDSECEKLFINIINTLKESIKYHGTTIINFKFDNMKTGNYKNKLNVYGRVNKPCNKCKNRIIKIRVAGRGTYICSKCQRIK